MSLKSFAIRSVKNLILIKLSGEWSMATDLSYLSELAEHISRFRSRKYCIFADMRGWQLEQPIKQEVAKTDVRFDRRSQKGECWLQATVNQAEHLVKFFDGLRFPLYRTTDTKDALDWAHEMLDEELHSQVSQWIETDIDDIEKIFPRTSN